MIHRLFIASAGATGALLLSACGDQSPAAGAPADASPPAWLLTSAPEGARSVTEAKAEATEGERIVLRGRIGGRADPISPESPVFTIVDLSLAYCGQEAEDGCPAPWDYCCETPETIAAHSATVQVIGSSGGAIAEHLTARELAPLDEVIVVGEVGPRPNPGVLTVRATGVYSADATPG